LTETNEPDIRDEILRGIANRTVTARIIADDRGILAETAALKREAEALGLKIGHVLGEGSPVGPGDEIARYHGRPKQIAMAEERLIGLIAKPSGIATAARRFVEKAGRRPEIVSGAWKKMPWGQKDMIRRAVIAGGAKSRIAEVPFLYLDKNYVRMLGGVRPCLAAVAGLNGYLKVVQVQGEYGAIDREAVDAVALGADIIFIDTGSPEDLARTTDALRRAGLRDRVRIAFGGGVQLEDMESLKALDADLLDVGRPIIDAPLLDMRIEIIVEKAASPDQDGPGRD